MRTWLERPDPVRVLIYFVIGAVAVTAVETFAGGLPLWLCFVIGVVAGLATWSLEELAGRLRRP
jgi:hypothetical protein